MLKKILIGASALAMAAGTAHAAPNTSYIEQVGNGNTATNTFAATASGNSAIIYQRGNSNHATNNVDGTSGDTEIYQGCSNTATYTAGCTASQSRTGNNNTATVTLSSGQNGATSYILQRDSYNSADVTLASTVSGTTSTIRQQGTQSTSANMQQAIVNVDAASTATVEINQGYAVDPSVNPPGTQATVPGYIETGLQNTSGRNYARSYVVTSTGATSRIFQSELSNYADVRQQNANNSYSEIRQSGTTPGTASGGNNYVTVNQNNDNQTSYVTQAGTSNHATIVQNAVGASSNVIQTGIGNTATVTQ